MLDSPEVVVSRVLVVRVYYGHLSAIHLHAVAGEDVDEQELPVGAGLDLLSDAGSGLVDP